MLRSVIARLRGGWTIKARTMAIQRLSQDFDLPPDAVSRILDRTATDLCQLSMAAFDARPIIDRAVRDLSNLGSRATPFEKTVMERYVHDLPDRDYQILRQFKQGKRHGEIAEQMGMDVESVRQSLERIYTGLRARMQAPKNECREAASY